MTGARPGMGFMLRYGVLGLPLAFAALPIYVHVPRLYADGFGIGLGVIGGVLLAARVVDALTDPLIGWVSDRYALRRPLIGLAVLILGLGLPALLAPPADVGAPWLMAVLIVVSLGYSLATINHAAWGAELGPDPDSRTCLVASREGFGLLGVILAAALPGVLADQLASGLARMVWVFVPLLLISACLSLGTLPGVSRPAPAASLPWSAVGQALGDRAFVALLAVFALNGVAAAVPASTVLFFVADVVQRDDLGGVFLAVYFVSGGVGLPLWVALAGRVGKLRAWLAGMVLAIGVFIWAGQIGAGEVAAFAAICVLSGLALGADLSLPQAMLVDLIARPQAAEKGSGVGGGTGFGLWALVSKLNLALAAGLALPLLAALGYTPGSREPGALAALSAVYAVLPVGLKLLAAAVLWRLRHHLEMEKTS